MARLRAPLLGVASSAVVVAVLIGVPWWLQTVFGWPVSGGLPGGGEVWDALRRELTDEVIGNGLVLGVWLAWAWWLGLPVLVEVVATVLGRDTPRLPFAGGSQWLATELVAGVLLLVSPWQHEGSAALAASAPAESVVTSRPLLHMEPASAVVEPAVTTEQHPAPASAAPEGEWYVVVPNDNPWRLAARFYGKGEHSTQLWNANAHRRMPSGRVYSRPGLIRPGDVLFVPDPARIHEYTSPSADVAQRSRALEPPSATCAPDAPEAAVPSSTDTAVRPVAAEPVVQPPTTQGEAVDAPATATTTTTTTADGDSDSGEALEESVVVSVRLPSGSVVGLAFVMGVASALATSAIHRRRAYRPSPVRLSRVAEADDVEEPFRTLGSTAAATERADEGMLRRAAWTDRRDPAPARIEAGTATEDVVHLDPIALGALRLEGEGADDVLRGVVASLLLRCLPGDLRVLVDAEIGELVGIDEPFPGVVVLSTPAEVLQEAEIERARRARILDAADCDDFASYRAEPSDELLGGLVLVGRPGAHDLDRWAALVAAGPRLGIGLAVLGGEPLPVGSSVVVQGDGVVVAADGDTRLPQGTSLYRLTRSDAVAVLQEVAAARRLAETPSAGKPPVEEPFPVAALPDEGQHDVEVPPVQVRVLGPFAIEAGGRFVRSGLLDKSRELLAYLVLRPDGARREAILEDLWGDADPARRQDRFSAAVSNLRGRVRDALETSRLEVVRCEGEEYRLEAELFDVDLWRFQRAIGDLDACEDDDQRASCLGAALSAYGGEFVHDAPWEWVEPERENLRRRALDVAVRLAEIHTEAGRLEPAIAAVERAIEVVDPYAEDLYVRGVRLLLAAGRMESARRLYDALKARLEELDVEPMPETVAAVGELLASARRPGDVRDPLTAR